MSSDKAEKQATIYGAACIDKMRAKDAASETKGGIVTQWLEEDMVIQMALENQVGIAVNVPLPIGPKRLFKAWIEDWEWDCIWHNNAVAEVGLIRKYGRMWWIDPDPIEGVGRYVHWRD